MRTFVPALCLVAALVCAPGASPASGGHVIGVNGVRAIAPRGWHFTNEVFSTCVSPSQTMAITNARGLIPAGARLSKHVGLVLLLEVRHGGSKGFPPRRTFRPVPSSSAMGGCCDMPEGRGAEFVFRDHGRDFYAFLYARDPSVARAAAAILETLQVEKD
ncbi:MAG: hypothetical protein E6G02_14460 [Actinobacteria bacterium]|nr:MAG: hypothetical protein E6G02_14460 [Actinomycetota bacterium]